MGGNNKKTGPNNIVGPLVFFLNVYLSTTIVINNNKYTYIIFQFDQVVNCSFYFVG